MENLYVNINIDPEEIDAQKEIREKKMLEGSLMLTVKSASLPQGFVYLKDPRMIFSMSYASDDNFVGRIINDYYKKVCILTEPAAHSLIRVQDALEKVNPNYQLKIFDGYRPTSAVLDFKEWAADFNDLKMKKLYYPNYSKPELFERGYIAEKSSHSRGSTVDLTITESGKELDMGTRFDFFGELSHTDNASISPLAKKNRSLLKELMHREGFQNLPIEWWHYTLKNEPFPETYFNFPVK